MDNFESFVDAASEILYALKEEVEAGPKPVDFSPFPSMPMLDNQKLELAKAFIALAQVVKPI